MTVCSYAPATNTILGDPQGQADILVPIVCQLYGLGAGLPVDKDTVIDVGFNYFVTKQSVRPIPAAT